MDIDTMHQPSLEVPVDEDLINYESDAGDYTLLSADDLKSGAAPEDNQMTYPDADPVDYTGGFDNQHSPETLALDGAAEAVSTIIPEVFDNQNEAEEAPETYLPVEPDMAVEAVAETVTDEIDYGLDVVDEHREQDEEGNDQVDSAENLPGVSEAGEEDHQDDKAEISWEHDEDATVTTGHFERDASEEREQDHDSLEAMTVETGGASEQPNADDDETESRDFRQDELQELEEAITGDTSMDTGGESSADSFPNITVQYQGDEFPFLSSGTNGFFSDASILDESIQHVLSGFRLQVGSDVRAEDELVFQVDELGLEFTEVSVGLPTNIKLKANFALVEYVI